MSRNTVTKSITTLIMSIIGVFMLLPFAWMISTSLKTPIEVFKFPIQWIPNELRFENYRHVLFNQYYPFWLFAWNSVKVSVLTIIGTVLVSALAGYAFAKIEFRGKNIIFLLYLATLMIPHHVTLVPRFILFYWFGIYNTHLALILPAVFNVIGIFLLRQFFSSVPNELSEAARIDGAGHLRIFTHVVVPIALPAFVSLLILSFVGTWNNYIDPLIFITSKNLYTIPLGIQAFLDEEGTQFNLVMAAAACAVLPIIAVFLFLQKYFIQGIATGGVKG